MVNRFLSPKEKKASKCLKNVKKDTYVPCFRNRFPILLRSFASTKNKEEMPGNDKGRTPIHTLSSFFSRIGRRLSAAHRGAFWHLPAFLIACSPLPESSPNPTPGMRKVQIYVLPSGKTTPETLDMFFFQADSLERLDAYQHFDAVPGNRIAGVSSTAAQKLAVFGNCPGDIYQWSHIRTFDSLRELAFSLEDEDPSSPVLTGFTEIPEGRLKSCPVTMRPMLSRITLQSIACDFSGRAYAGEKLQDVRAYLTYASEECRPFAPEEPPAAWLNAGRLDEAGTAALAHPEAVLRTLAASLGGRIYPSAGFYCYPNPADGTDFGSPVTRLVIEGKLRGTTYYYPIDLPGLEADVQYRMDVTLTRTGTTDPDTPAVSGSIRLESQVLDWDGRDWEDIHYR